LVLSVPCLFNKLGSQVVKLKLVEELMLWLCLCSAAFVFHVKEMNLILQ
jgi:hypothetical protein